MRSASSACSGIVNECNANGGEPAVRVRVPRPGTNAVTAVLNPWLNINNARVRGLDYEVLWNRDMDCSATNPRR